MKTRDLKKLLTEFGFEKIRSGKGDHEIWGDPEKGRTFPVDGAPGHEVPRGTLKSVFQQAGLDPLVGVKTYKEARIRMRELKVDEYLKDIGPGPGRVGKALKFLGRVGKLAGAFGVVGAAAEAAELDAKLESAVNHHLVLPEAASEYSAIIGGHITQATLDPSLVGGEAAVQAAFDAWAERHDVPQAVRESLEPSSLIEDIFGEIGNEAATHNTNNHFDMSDREGMSALFPGRPVTTDNPGISVCVGEGAFLSGPGAAFSESVQGPPSDQQTAFQAGPPRMHMASTLAK